MKTRAEMEAKLAECAANGTDISIAAWLKRMDKRVEKIEEALDRLHPFWFDGKKDE